MAAVVHGGSYVLPSPAFSAKAAIKAVAEERYEIYERSEHKQYKFCYLNFVLDVLRSMEPPQCLWIC